MSDFKLALVDSLSAIDPNLSQNFGVQDFAYEVAQAMPGAKVMPLDKYWSWVYFEDDHIALGLVGYGDFRTKGDGTMLYTVKAPSIRNGKYSDYSSQYNMVMSADRSKAVKNARKYLRRISPVEATNYTKTLPRDAVSKHRTALDVDLDEAQREVFGRPLGRRIVPILSELRALVAADYTFLHPNSKKNLQTVLALTDERQQHDQSINMAAVFLSRELGRQRADVVLVDKLEMWWPYVGETHDTFYDDQIPEYIREKAAVLSMLHDEAYVHGVGYRLNARIFYVHR